MEHNDNNDSVNITTGDTESTNQIPHNYYVPLNNAEAVNTVESPIFKFPARYSDINDIYLQLTNTIPSQIF